ncbi:TetR/AcrR family transcriptional regulator [Cohnella nanjingensis]|uniref:Helix-turn-helix transcriptional regulator n=1 Tax=Cohnella nanjingensis TaxID=1387779 RepID=A0A7X0RXV9_9BACL|nr:TetR/AcrR family transcriptional regulator [Cohnella nanjingensis]MBB6675659.1 helix-turn-helix transcriptional regulator [Cohnella nanjingensis]
MEIALERFAKYGYRQTKISDIVGQAGVAQGTFYWYFKSKEAVALEIIRSGQEKLLSVIQQGYRKQAGSVQDMVQASEGLLAGIFGFARDNRHLMEMLLTGSGGDETIRQAAHETRIAMEEAFRRNMNRAIELGMLPESMNPGVRAALLMSLIEGVIARWLFGPTHPESGIGERSAEELAAETARFEFFGLLGV